MQRAARLLLAVGLGAILTIGFTGCGDKRPVYESGMSKKEFGEKFGNWFGSKIADNANEAEIEKYKEKTTDIIKVYQTKVKNQKLKDDILELTDNMIKEVLSLAEDTYGLDEDDWNYIVNPEVDDSASKQSQLEIKFALRQMMAMFPTYKFGYFPSSLEMPIKESTEKINNGEVYAYILNESKYKIIIEDHDWLKKYEAKKIILNTAKKIAKEEKLYFDVKINGFGRLDNQEQKKIKDLKYKYKFEIINNSDVVGYGSNRTIFDLKDIVNSKSKDEFRANYEYIKYAKRDLDNSKKYLLEKEKYLKKHPGTSWVKEDVKKYKLKVEQNTAKLEQANIKFDKIYTEDINKLNNQIQELEALESSLKHSVSKYQHNIKVFIKTYQTLINKGYKNHIIEEFLSNGRPVYGADKYNISQNIKFKDNDGIAFSDYMETMQKLLK